MQETESEVLEPVDVSGIVEEMLELLKVSVSKHAALETDLNQVNGAADSEPLPAGALAALQTSFGRFTGDQARLAYDASARAARQLLDEAGGFAVANLLRDLGQGVDFNQAFLHRIQRPFESFEADLSTTR